jgi:hypothetical protein
MRNLLMIIFGLFIIAGLSNCKKCKKEDPRARIINSGSQKASVQIQTSGGNTVNMNNVQPGSTSDFTTFAAGEVVFTVSVGNKTNVVSYVTMETCYEYDIFIDDNGVVQSTATDRNKK